MKVLIVNSAEPRCGVFQYGINLFSALRCSREHNYEMCHPESQEELEKWVTWVDPEVIIYNWAPGIGGYGQGAPFHYAPFEVAVYHDGKLDAKKFSAVLFSDPTMAQHDNWYPIARPIPKWIPKEQLEHSEPWIGVNGFLGAWAFLAVDRILSELENIKIRLHLPFAAFGDSKGAGAQQVAAECQEKCDKVSVELEVTHEFMPMPGLLHWLSENDLNLYMRHTEAEWSGVSSVLDAALAVRRPIAVNKCAAFRHVHNLTPSICVEDTPLKKILEMGTVPLEPLYSRWSQSTLAREVDLVLGRICVTQEPVGSSEAP